MREVVCVYVCVYVLETYWVIALSASPRRTYSLTTSDGCVCSSECVCVEEREKERVGVGEGGGCSTPALLRNLVLNYEVPFF